MTEAIERCYVISDLHVAGRVQEPKLDSFAWDETFVGFIAAISQRERTILVINGDFVDFAQIPSYEVPEDRTLLWDERASVDKLRIAMESHPRCFGALARFVGGTSGDAAMDARIATGGRVVIINGNHDFDWQYQAVRDALRSWLGDASDDRLEFHTGTWRFHNVHIEHGYSFTPENCPKGVHDFVHELRSGDRFIERVWGTDFMLAFYNDLKRKHSFAGHVEPAVSVAFHALKNRWIGGGELARLLRFLVRRPVPAAAIGTSLSDEDLEPVTLAHVVRRTIGPWQSMLLELQQDEDFESDFDEAIARLDDASRAELARVKRFDFPPDDIGERAEEDPTLGVIRSTTREERAAANMLALGEVSHVIYGHTHDPIDGGLDGRWFNTGSWMPSLDLKDPAIRRKIAKGGLTYALLENTDNFVVRPYTAEILAGGGSQAEVSLVEIAKDGSLR